VPVESSPDRAEEAARRGELWRAREILQSQIRNSNYDCVLFERLGMLLLQMGELLEAGKFLFLSGARKTSYEGPIALFVNRFTRKKPLHLYYMFPRAARLKFRKDYPPAVESELARLGLPAKLPAPTRSPTTTGHNFWTRIVGLGCVTVVTLVLVLAVIGAIGILQWLRG
jgi:hypothetical protein